VVAGQCVEQPESQLLPKRLLEAIERGGVVVEP
jgi:hypothetical protein